MSDISGKSAVYPLGEKLLMAKLAENQGEVEW